MFVKRASQFVRPPGLEENTVPMPALLHGQMESHGLARPMACSVTKAESWQITPSRKVWSWLMCGP